MFSRLIYLLSFNMFNNLWPPQPRSSVLDILYFVYASYAAVVPEVSTSRRCFLILSRIRLPTVRHTAASNLGGPYLSYRTDVRDVRHPAVPQPHQSSVRGLSGLTDCNIISIYHSGRTLRPSGWHPCFVFRSSVSQVALYTPTLT